MSALSNARRGWRRLFDLGVDGGLDAFALGAELAPVAAPVPDALDVGVVPVEDFGQVEQAAAYRGVQLGDGLLPLVDVAGGREGTVGGGVAERAERDRDGQVADVVDEALAGGEREEADDGDLGSLLSEPLDPP
ncbi:hypothetical protein ADK55_33350 [Streptomyces sp. WM4235]|nr:hypothetical protein ADK55_33350 [Streptomyces sp. WM4235]